MAKVEIVMELGGFKIDSFKVHIKADREDIPRINGEIGKQFMHILQPPANLIDEPERKQILSTVVPPTDVANAKSSGRSKGGRRLKGTATAAAPAVSVVWTHDAAKWGMPKQSWPETNKALWLLYVMTKETGKSEVSGPSIADTFNDKFRQFGPLKKPNLPRTMGRLKTNSPAYVMDNTGAFPIAWYLTNEGTKAAERLVIEAKSPNAESPGNA
jgi:hypothetical protein